MTPTLRPKQVCEVVNSFIRVIIEQLWYHLDVYPQESFDQYVFYDLEVYSCRHPQVIAYLDSLVNELKVFLSKGLLKNLYMDVLQVDNRICSFALSFRDSLMLDQLKSDPLFYEVDDEVFDGFELITHWKSLLYSIISELSKTILGKKEEISDFKILISTNNDSVISVDDKWILEKSLNQTMQNADTTIEDVDLHPFQAIALGYMNIKSYVAFH